jgi:uncharacterized protein YdbL (DUF1318 family)
MRNAARWLALISALVLTLAAGPALAADLDGAKAAGQVGERVDGYLGLVDEDAPDDVKALVERVNTGRREKYGQIAAKRGVPLEAVAVAAGAKLIERAEPGHYVMDEEGNWKQKE